MSSGRKKGRENDEEVIYVNSVGLSYIDLNFSNYIYKEAMNRGLGKDVILAEKIMLITLLRFTSKQIRLHKWMQCVEARYLQSETNNTKNQWTASRYS